MYVGAQLQNDDTPECLAWWQRVGIFSGPGRSFIDERHGYGTEEVGTGCNIA